MTRLVWVIVVVACGGAHPDPQRPAAGGERPASGVRPASDGKQPVDLPAGNKDDKCDKLIDRVVTLAVAERPAEHKPTDDERASIVTQLRTSWAPKCKEMTSKGYDCAVSAQTLAELDRCGG